MQNSWGPRWGTKGFAILPYDDWIARGTDAWAVVLGAPIEHAESPHYHENEALSVRARRETPRPFVGGSPAPAVSPAVAPWTRDNAYRHAIVMGNNGTLVNRSVSRQALSAFDHVVVEAPTEWCGTGASRVLLYAHGGLNAEEESVKRIQVMAPYFLANGIYPIFFTWRTGVLESLTGIFEDIKQGCRPDGRVPRRLARGQGHHRRSARPRRRGRLPDGGRQGDLVADEAERQGGARLPAADCRGHGKVAQHDPTLVLLAARLERLKKALPKLEVHLVGHSAGSILFGHLLDALSEPAR